MEAKLYTLAVGLLGLGFGFLHRWHVSTLFENDRHFSHLSEIEREMSFRTEMGMYYSYYKTIAESKDFPEGLSKLRNDSTSEYGNIINAGVKYSLLPEMLTGFLYHWAKNLGIVGKECWQIERGDGLPPITSCEGLEVPIYFYLEIVWLTTIFTAAILFYYSTYLSNSVASGFITILLFFYNHNECTRVQWTPPLRESFAYPVLLFQMYRWTIILREWATNDGSIKPIPKGLFVDVCFATVISLCSWKFSEFVFLTQTIAVLILRWTKIITDNTFFCFCAIHTCSMGGFLYITWDVYDFHPLYIWVLAISSVSTHLSGLTEYVGPKIETALEILFTIVSAALIKFYLIGTADDTHVFNILRAKISGYKDFHTMLYTCSAEFDFLQYRTYETIINTLLLPSAILAGMLVLYFWYRNYNTKGYPKCIEPEVAYTGLQTGAFIIMAVFIMRLKLFMNPHLCIIAGAVCAKRYLEKVGIKTETMRGAIIVLLIAGMSYHGYDRFQEERSIMGEYSNIEQEELFQWIKMNTPKNAVFAGKMSLMANLMLSTKRPIVNNPYYECKKMRDKTMKVYEIFSRKFPTAVYSTLKNLNVNYVVLEEPLCLGYANLQPGCQMLDLWDLMDNGAAKAAGRPALCPILFQGKLFKGFKNSTLFRRAFINNQYVVLQLDYSHYVEVKPNTSLPLVYKS